MNLEPTSRFAFIIITDVLGLREALHRSCAFESVVTMDQNFLRTYSWLPSTWALAGNESKAFEWFRNFCRYGSKMKKPFSFKTAFQTSGWDGVLREWVNRIETVGGNNFDGAAYSAQIGEKDKAFEFLEKVYQRREYTINFIQVDPRLDNLRDDPRFVELVRRIRQ